MDLTYYNAKDLRKLIKKHQMYYAVCAVDHSFRAEFKLHTSGFDAPNEDIMEFLRGMYRRLERASKALPFLLAGSDDEYDVPPWEFQATRDLEKKDRDPKM